MPSTAGSWRHPATEHGFLDAGYYQKLGRTLEEGCFDLMFFDDRLAMPGIYGGSVAEAVRLGARPVKLDLSIVLGLVAGATQHIGLGRDLLDHLLLAVPRRPHLRHARPPLRRPGGVERGHLGQRQRGAELRGRRRTSATTSATTGPTSSSRPPPACGTPGTTTPSSSTGRRAPSPTPTRSTSSTTRASGSACGARSPCPARPRAGPVLLQAGSSGRGRDFAARWAELIFTGDPDIDIARSHYKDQKDRIAELGPRPGGGEDAADGLHGRGRVAGPRRGARAGVPQRPGRPEGVAHPALRADELRLLGHGARRPHHRRADRVGVGHPGPGAEPAPAHRRRHGHARPTWPATGPRCCRAPASSAPAPRSPTRWRSGSRRRLRRLRRSPPPTSPAPTRTWCAWSCPSSSAAACSATATRASTLRDHLGLDRPAVARPWLTAAPGPLAGRPRRRGGHARRRPDGRHRARRVRRRGDQGRAARRRRPDAHLGQPQGRHRPGVEERQPQQALRHPRPPPARGPGAVPPAARRQRRAHRRQPAQRPRALGDRLRDRSTPPTRRS